MLWQSAIAGTILRILARIADAIAALGSAISRAVGVVFAATDFADAVTTEGLREGRRMWPERGRAVIARCEREPDRQHPLRPVEGLGPIVAVENVTERCPTLQRRQAGEIGIVQILRRDPIGEVDMLRLFRCSSDAS